MRIICLLLGNSLSSIQRQSSRRAHSLLICCFACLAQSSYSHAAVDIPVFQFGFTHINQSGAEEYLVETSGVRKYSEWQNPPITYWGPVANNQVGTLVYRLKFPGPSSKILLKAHSPLWNVGPGFGRGASAFEVSRDGSNWVSIWNGINPLQWGQGFTIDSFLPQEVAGSSELWVRIKLLVTEAPNSSYTTAQFGRSTSSESENVFEVRAYTTDPDFDDDGLEDIYETDTGSWISATDTGTDPSNPDTDGDGLLDGVETNTGAYVSPTDTGTDPNAIDTDRDSLPDGVETATAVFIGTNDTGTDPNNADTSGDGILDGEAVLWNFNPLTDHSQVLAFLRHATGVQSGRFGLFTERSIMDLNLGGVMIQKSGSQASVRFKVLSKMDLRDAIWSDRGTYLLPPIDMPGSKGFLRIGAEQ